MRTVESQIAAGPSCTAAIMLSALLAACAPQSGGASFSTATVAALHDLAVESAGNPNPKAPIEFDGFSILPPQGEHWIQQRHPPDPKSTWLQPIAFLKVLPQHNPEHGIHTVVANVEARKLTETERRQTATKEGREDFLNFGLQVLAENDRVNAESKQDRIISTKGHLDSSLSYDCLKYDVFAETQHVKGFEGRRFYVEFHTYACIDPESKMIVKLAYAQRLPPNTTPVDLSVEGESFLKSLKFTTPVG